MRASLVMCSLHLMEDEQLKRFSEVTERHRWTIYKVCRHYGRVGRVPEEDLLQEVLIELWLKLGRMEASNVRVESGWVRTVARNVAANYVKSEDVRKRHGQNWKPDASPDADEAARLVDEMMAQLDSTDSAILRLDLEGYSDAEIAAVTGLSTAAVSMRLYRIKRKLRELETES